MLRFFSVKRCLNGWFHFNYNRVEHCCVNVENAAQTDESILKWNQVLKSAFPMQLLWSILSTMAWIHTPTHSHNKMETEKKSKAMWKKSLRKHKHANNTIQHNTTLGFVWMKWKQRTQNTIVLHTLEEQQKTKRKYKNTNAPAKPCKPSQFAWQTTSNAQHSFALCCRAVFTLMRVEQPLQVPRILGGRFQDLWQTRCPFLGHQIWNCGKNGPTN